MVHKDKKFKCEQCTSKFATPAHLRRHVTAIHDEIRLVYKCDQCDKKYSTTEGLKEHQKVKHGNESHECELC